MRNKINQMVHVYEGNPLSVTYKWCMIVAIIASILPLTFKTPPLWFAVVEGICFGVFILDYLLRWITADYKFGTRRWTAFVKYPFRLISIIDLLSVIALAYAVFGWSLGGHIAEVLAVFRIVRIFRYSKSARTILGILRISKKPLMAVGGLAVGYILISAIVIFNVEPASFSSFFDAIYWATVSLTTVGYGDIYPVTVLGRAVAMLSSFFGIAVVALPAGIITAEYLNSLKCDKE
jgi:voltage-gated potassium channel